MDNLRIPVDSEVICATKMSMDNLGIPLDSEVIHATCDLRDASASNSVNCISRVQMLGAVHILHNLGWGGHTF